MSTNQKWLNFWQPNKGANCSPETELLLQICFYEGMLSILRDVLAGPEAYTVPLAIRRPMEVQYKEIRAFLEPHQLPTDKPTEQQPLNYPPYPD